jgi:hypothetical protein
MQQDTRPHRRSLEHRVAVGWKVALTTKVEKKLRSRSHREVTWCRLWSWESDLAQKAWQYM